MRHLQYGIELLIDIDLHSVELLLSFRAILLAGLDECLEYLLEVIRELSLQSFDGPVLLQLVIVFGEGHDLDMLIIVVPRQELVHIPRVFLRQLSFLLQKVKPQDKRQLLTHIFVSLIGLQLEKVIVVLQCLPNCQYNGALLIFQRLVHLGVPRRKVVGVGQLNEEVSQICVACLPAQLINLPPCAGACEIAVLCPIGILFA